MNKSVQLPNEEKSNVSVESILSVIKFGLENLDALKGADKKVRVKDISIMNLDTLSCKFYSYSDNSTDIKVEIATIMGFFNGFFKDDSFENVDFKNYAVRAYDENDNELLYAISSKKAAQLIGEGNSVDWLKSTLFQENTSDYRLGIAKRVISEIENCLRTVVKDILQRQFSADWWDQALNNKLGKKIKTAYNDQFGEVISDGDVLVKYSYLLDLKKIISTHWTYFKHLFSSKIEFEDAIDLLNKIRREEAHNREITDEHLIDLNKLHNTILSTISEEYPETLSTYLIDNWRSKIQAIMHDSYKPLYKGKELVDEPNPKLKLFKSVESTKHLIEYIENTVNKLESVVTPIQKKKIHNEIIVIFEDYKTLQEKKLKNVVDGEFDELLITIKFIEEHELKMNQFVEKFLLSES